MPRSRTASPTRRKASKTTDRDNSSATVQMELRTSEERWRSLLNNPIFGVTFLDENQRFITTSQTFQSMVGYSDEELRQLTPLDISVPGEREINEDFFSQMRRGERQHYEMIKQLRAKLTADRCRRRRGTRTEQSSSLFAGWHVDQRIVKEP